MRDEDSRGMKKLRVEFWITRGRYCYVDVFLEQDVEEKPAHRQIERYINAERILGQFSCLLYLEAQVLERIPVLFHPRIRAEDAKRSGI
jgi:hypothetical protein